MQPPQDFRGPFWASRYPLYDYWGDFGSGLYGLDHFDRVEVLSIDGRRLSVRLSAVPDFKSRTEGLSKLKIGRKETHVTSDPIQRSKGQRSRSPGRSGWLFKSLIKWGILWQPHYRPQSLLGSVVSYWGAMLWTVGLITLISHGFDASPAHWEQPPASW